MRTILRGRWSVPLIDSGIDRGESVSRTDAGAMTFGVVIPARDEAGRIGACLASLAPFREAGDPILVVDDRSTDGTAVVAAAGGAEVLRAGRPGRGFAVAAGVDRALELGVQVVVIAHADMTVPRDARGRLTEALRADPSALGGCLGNEVDESGFAYRIAEWGNRFRARRLRLPYGDQAQFLRAWAVHRIGGFPRQERLEDLELALRLRRAGRTVYVGCPVTIPGRHWRPGVVRTSLRDWAVVTRYLIGRDG